MSMQPREYEVSCITDIRSVDGKKEYLISWKGETVCTWEQEQNLKNCQAVVRSFKEVCMLGLVQNIPLFVFFTFLHDANNIPLSQTMCSFFKPL